MIKKHKLAFEIVLLLLLISFALWFTLHKDFDAIMAILADIHIGWFLVTVCLGVSYYGLAGSTITIIAKRYHYNYNWRKGACVAFSGALFNGITPIGCGQVAQAYVFRKQGIALKEGAGILWMDFIVFQCVVLFYALVLMILRLPTFYQASNYFLLVIVGYIINAFVIVMLASMLVFPKLYVFLSTKAIFFLHRIHIVRDPKRMQASWEEQLRCFTQQITLLKRDKTLVIKLVSLQLFRMSIYYALPVFAALSVHQIIDWPLVFNIVALSSFIHMLNALTPLPGDTGFTESAFVLVFSTIFVWNIASSVMLLWRFASYPVILVIGACMFIRVCGKQNVKVLLTCEVPVVADTEKLTDL